MLFTLRNLGKLEEATIDLGKDLIVLTGSNNTSKTYVAHAIYGFCRALQNLRFLDIVRRFVANDEPPVSDRLEIDLLAFLDAHLDSFLNEIGERYTNELTDVFAADTDFTSRARVSIRVDREGMDAVRRHLIDAEEHLTLAYASVEKRAGAGVWIFAGLPESPNGRRENQERSATDRWHSIRDTGVVVALNRLCGALFPDMDEPYILAAERAAIQLFSRELSLKRDDLVDSLLRVPGGTVQVDDLLRKGARRYPLPIRDGLHIANDLSARKKYPSTYPYAALADSFERDILQGSVRVDDDGEMTFHPEESKKTLSMHLTSSSVKALSGLAFYLRHRAMKGEFLIIDEPELNLHPHNQRLVARLLARLARSGIKVLISTHSDYIIRELNNLLMLSADKDGKLREKYGYDEAETLSPERVGAYLFDGAHAHPIPIEPAGIGVAAIDKEVRELNRSSRDIYLSLFDQDEP